MTFIGIQKYTEKYGFTMATIELEVKKIYPDISKSEQRAADFFLNNKEAIFHYPLATLAKLSKTSQGAWVRFCKSLGYDGMKSLKNTLFNEINNAKEEADENAIEFTEDRAGHDLRYPMDCEKIKNELDWTPQYAFKEALDETVAWYRSRML